MRFRVAIARALILPLAIMGMVLLGQAPASAASSQCRVRRVKGMLTRARAGVAAALVVLLTAIGLAVMSLPAQAAPAEDAAATPKVQQHCMYLLDKLRPGQEVSEVVRSTCLTDASSVALYCDDPRATFYEDVNYGGRRLTFCGNYGTCDAAGYGFRHMGAFPANAASSFRVYAGCNLMRLYDVQSFGGANITYFGSRSWVGATINDRPNHTG
jgi:hypothetical protein